MPTWAERFSSQLARLPGVYLAPSKFSDAPAYFKDGKELLHFHGDAAIDLRLGRKEIRARRQALADTDLVHFRKSSSADWLEVEIDSKKGLALALELVRAAT